MNFGIFFFFFLFVGIAPATARWPGIAVFCGISAFMSFLFLGPGPLYLRLGMCLIWAVLITAMFLRAGLLGAMLGLLAGDSGLPLFLDLDSWYAGGTILIWLVIAAIGVYGLHTALAGRSIFGGGAPSASLG